MLTFNYIDTDLPRGQVDGRDRVQHPPLLSSILQQLHVFVILRGAGGWFTCGVDMPLLMAS